MPRVFKTYRHTKKKPLQTVKSLVESSATLMAHGFKWVKYHLHFSGLERLKNTPDILKRTKTNNPRYNPPKRPSKKKDQTHKLGYFAMENESPITVE